MVSITMFVVGFTLWHAGQSWGLGHPWTTCLGGVLMLFNPAVMTILGWFGMHQAAKNYYGCKHDD